MDGAFFFSRDVLVCPGRLCNERISTVPVISRRKKKKKKKKKRDRNKGEQIQLEVGSRYSMLPFNFFLPSNCPHPTTMNELAYYCRSRHRKIIESGIEWKLP